ncbi:MAG: hypothetical protein V3V82_07855, partial [Acidimicrobiia bacterium]
PVGNRQYGLSSGRTRAALCGGSLVRSMAVHVCQNVANFDGRRRRDVGTEPSEDLVHLIRHCFDCVFALVHGDCKPFAESRLPTLTQDLNPGNVASWPFTCRQMV